MRPIDILQIKPSLLSLTRPICECIAAENSQTISSQIKRLLETPDGPELSKALATMDFLRNWNILRLMSTGYSCAFDVHPPESKSPSGQLEHPALIIEATACPLPGHSVIAVSNVGVCELEFSPCDLDLSPDFFGSRYDAPGSPSIAGEDFSPKTILDLALLIRFTRKRLSHGVATDVNETVSGCYTILRPLVQIFKELHYPWVEPATPSIMTVACPRKFPRCEILSIICDFERERAGEAVKALERVEQERTERIWSILNLNLKLEKLENHLAVKNTAQCGQEYCDKLYPQEYHLTFHFGRALSGECHYIQ